MKALNIIAYLLAAGLFLSVPSAYAQDGASQEETFTFSRVSPDPAYLGTGLAGRASYSSVAFASFTNPAVLPFFAGTMDIRGSYVLYAPSYSKMSSFAGGLGYNFGKVGISAGLQYMTERKYDVLDEVGDFQGTFTPSDINASFGVGYRPLDNLSFGLSARYLGEKLSDDVDYSAFAVDFLAYGRLPIDERNEIDLTGGIANVGSSIKPDSGESYSAPSSVVLAAQYLNRIPGTGTLGFDLDADYFLNSKAFTLAVGGKFVYDDILSIRAGYHYATDDAAVPSFASLGLGVKFEGVCIDLAYLFASDTVKNSLGISLGYTF